MSGADGGSGTIILKFLAPSTSVTSTGSTGSSGTSYTGLTVLVGGVRYNPLVGSLNIDNRIGERGTCSFQLYNLPIFNQTNNGGFLNGGTYIGTAVAPSVGTPIVFTGATPSGVYASKTYYVKYRHSTGLYFQISTTPGGETISWTLADTLNTTWNEYTLSTFEIGENIDIYIEGILVWSGVIERINKQLPQGTNTILYSIRGVSWNYACDKRRVVSSYSTDVTAGLSAAYIVNDLLTNYLRPEGINTGIISSGANFGNVVFNYIQPSKCLDILAEQSGYIWQINPDKTLDFKPHDFETIAFGVGATEIAVNSMQYTETNPKYRNVQYVVGGYDLTSTQDEYQWGDDEKQAFAVKYEVMKTPYVNIVTMPANTTSTQDVGILGIDTTKQWYWNKFSNIISQNTSDTPLSTSKYIHVQYIGGYPQVSASVSGSAITSRRSVEGGTGIVEHVLNQGRDSWYDDNIVLGNKLIDKYSTMTNTLTFKTHTGGVTPGKILKVTVMDFDLSSEEMLVDTVQIKDDQDGIIWYTVSALTGPEHGGWSKYFDEFMTRTIERDIWMDAVAGDVISVTTNWNETFTWTEATTESIFACYTPCAAASSTTFYPATTSYPC